MMKKTLFFALFTLVAPSFLLAETPQKSQKPSHYMVKKGDCLWTISKDIYGDPQKWPMLYVANQGKIQNPNLIYPGQKFSVPANFTAEDLKKATQLANEKAQPLQAVAPLSRETTERAASKPAAKEETSSTSSKEAPPTSSEKTAPVAAQEQQVPSASSSNLSSAVTIIIVAILTVLGGIFLWRKSRESTPVLQEPKPLSSFPEMKENRASPVTSVTPSTPASPPLTTSVEPAVSQTPPVASAPSPSPAPDTPATEPPQAQLPLESTPPPSEPEKPSDNQAPPASPGHAA